MQDPLELSRDVPTNMQVNMMKLVTALPPDWQEQAVYKVRKGLLLGKSPEDIHTTLKSLRKAQQAEEQQRWAAENPEEYDRLIEAKGVSRFLDGVDSGEEEENEEAEEQEEGSDANADDDEVELPAKRAKTDKKEKKGKKEKKDKKEKKSKKEKKDKKKSKDD
ncbi:hypothetical protein DIPPA_12322 [Diplonema papillatum]|nr:hypothetical protein DIPPA_12322 [Diplonema papillatum]|eukprot:gene14050-21499_t